MPSSVSETARIFSSTNEVMRFDWQLHLRKLPDLTVSYDKRSDGAGIYENPEQVTRGGGLALTARDTVFGWELNGSYDDRHSTYESTGLSTELNSTRIDARRLFTPDVWVTVHGAFEGIDFASTANTRRIGSAQA